MRMINLVENTEGSARCACEHGLCFYIETVRHKLLMDTGASNLLLENARKLGVDLSGVDTVILSHGHYDHGGGIIPFAGVNPGAKIYMQETAFGDYYSIHDGKERYIGLSEEIRALPQVITVGAGAASASGSMVSAPGTAPDLAPYTAPSSAPGTSSDPDRINASPGTLQIDDELTLFWEIGTGHPSPSGNKALKIRKKLRKTGKEALAEVAAETASETVAGTASEIASETAGTVYVQDDFRHEQCLVIRLNGMSILLSGCAHHGILNILDRYHALFDRDPDVVISGFHMMQKKGYSSDDIGMITDTALALKEYNTRFYTCHCTDTLPYEVMRKIMGDQLVYVHCGDEIDLDFG